ncbi:MAG: mechanosensitive ion channel family protein [Alphaproteobacteria bacterium]|nr:mechanosensitive ion channel family protein [Alphaproteobacteria bacterium]
MDTSALPTSSKEDVAALPEIKTPENLDEIATTLLGAIKTLWVQFIEHVPLLIIGAVILMITWAISKVILRVLTKVLRQNSIRGSLIDLICRLTSIAIWLLGLLVAAMVIFPGLTPSNALGALGLFSLAIGFAFKDIFENFFAGILMLWKFPFENEDYIECEGIEGKIVSITVRQTLILKTSGEMIVVPNAFLFKNPVEVLTYKTRRRVIVMTGVAYDEDVTQSCEVITKAVENCASVDKEHPIQVFPHGFGESSIDIEVAWWTEAKPVDIRSSRGEVVTAIKKALDEAGIEIPFPYRTLTFKENVKVALNAPDSQTEASNA